MAKDSAEGCRKGRGSGVESPSERRSRERRKHKRITSFATLVYRPMRAPEGRPGTTHYMPADSFNLSVSGAMFCANQCLEVGERIKVRIRLFDVLADDPELNLLEIAGTSDLVAEAEVQRTEEASKVGYRIAVKFVDLIDGDLGILSEFIEKKEGHSHY